MHFWINKGTTSFQYGGRRRPTYFSSGTFASAGFGRERNNLVIPPRYPSISSNRETYAYTSSNPNDLHHLRSPRPSSQNTHNLQNSTSNGQRRRRERRSNSTPILPLPYANIPNTTTSAPDSNQSNHPHQHHHHHHHGRNFSTSTTTTLDSLTDSHNSRTESELDFDQCCCCQVSTKRVGLTLCFLGFILLCTVAGKFIVEGPSVIDNAAAAGARKGSSSNNTNNIIITQSQNRPNSTSVSYFLITEILFIAFALGFFLLGIACLRKRTNDYLLRQYRQQIQNSSHRNNGTPADDSLVLETGANEEETDPTAPAVTATAPRIRNHNSAYVDSGPGRSRRYYNLQHARAIKQEPPPYDVALYLPLPNVSRPHHASRFPESPSEFNTSSPQFHHDPNYPYFKSYKTQNHSQISLDKSSGSRSNTETPPPSYQEQFSLEI